MWKLNDTFEESTLPFRVDLVDRSSISDAFFRAISAELVPLPGSERSDA